MIHVGRVGWFILLVGMLARLGDSRSIRPFSAGVKSVSLYWVKPISMVVVVAIAALLFAVYIVRLFLVFPLPAAAWLQTRPGWLFGAQLLLVLVWQFSRIRNQEYNVDESTWIANALAVMAEPDFAASLLTYTTARPMTVLPLLLLAKLHLPISYVYIKVVSLLFIALSVLLTYRTLRHLTNARLAVLFCFPLMVFYAAIQFDDFLAYNSELVCNVCVVAGVWLYSRIARQHDRLWHITGVGLLLGLLPFVKFQAIPGGLVVAVLCLYTLVQQGRLRAAGVLIIAGLFPLVATALYCLLTDQLTILVRNYFLYYFHYSYQYSNVPLEERMAPRNIIYYYRRQYTFAAYWIGLLLLMGLGVWYSRKRPFRWSAPVVFLTLLWAVSIYETIQAGTYYEHYLNLTLVPHTLLAAVLVYPAVKNDLSPTRWLAYAYVGAALVITFFSHTKPFEPGYRPPLPYDGEVVTLIRTQCRPTDRITVWGWADRYYAESQVAPASRYANSVFQMKQNAQQGYYLDQYLIDLKQHRPLLFVDAVAFSQFTYSDPLLYAHERFPALHQFITANYQLIFERGGLRIYKLKGGRQRAAPTPSINALKSDWLIGVNLISLPGRLPIGHRHCLI